MQRRYDFISKLQLQKREGKLHCATTLDELEKQDALPGFNRWPILPNEIQRMIWIAALPGPRTVTVSPEGGGPLPRTADQERYIAMTDSKIASSGMHAACRESRKVYLQFYKREFEGQFRNPVFFDLGVDSLYLPDRIAMACLEGDRKGQLYVPKINEPHKTWRPKLRHLIVGPFFHQGRSGLRAAAFLTSLETLVMEAPGIVNEIFRMTFHGSKAQMKKEIMRQLDELWARQVADGTREKMPVVQWITSRNLLRKIKAEKVTFSCPRTLIYTKDYISH